MAETLHDIVEDIFLEAQDPDSIFRNKKRYNIVRYGRQGLQELGLTFATHLKGMNVTIPTSCRVYKPEGFETFVRAYLLDCDGRTVEIKRNPNIPEEILQYLLNCDGSILSDCDGELYTDCLICNTAESKIECNQCTECDGTGKLISPESKHLLISLEKYKDSWVKAKGNLDYFEFSSDLEGMAVVIEYLSNDVFENDECLITIDSNLRDALTYYVKFKLLENGMETMSQAQYFRRMFKSTRDREAIRNNALTKFDIYSLFTKK